MENGNFFLACSFKFRIVYKAKAITDIFCKNGHNECECNIIYYNVAFTFIIIIG